MNSRFQTLADNGVTRRVANGTFTAKLWPTVFMLAGVLLLTGLGSWQLERLAWKQQLIHQIATRAKELPQDVRSLSPLYWRANGRADTSHRMAADELEYRPASAIGQFLYTEEMYLLAPSITGEAGYHVLTPLQLEDGRWLLVDRGWIPYNRKPDMPGTKTGTTFARPAGTVQVAGLLHVPHSRWLTPANKPAHNDWYSVDLNEMSATAGLPGFLPFVLDADSDPNSGGFPVGGQTRLDLPNNHLGYALTWFGLALALVAMYFYAGYKRDPRPLVPVLPAPADQPLLPYVQLATSAPTVTRPIDRRNGLHLPRWLAKLFEVPEPVRQTKPASERPALLETPTPVSVAVSTEPAMLVKKPRKPRVKKVVATSTETAEAIASDNGAAHAAAVTDDIAKPARKRRKKVAAGELAEISTPRAIINPEIVIDDKMAAPAPIDAKPMESVVASPVAQAAEPAVPKNARKPRKKKAAIDQNGAEIDPAQLESLSANMPAGDKPSGGTIH